MQALRINNIVTCKNNNVTLQQIYESIPLLQLSKVKTTKTLVSHGTRQDIATFKIAGKYCISYLYKLLVHIIALSIRTLKMFSLIVSQRLVFQK